LRHARHRFQRDGEEIEHDEEHDQLTDQLADPVADCTVVEDFVEAKAQLLSRSLSGRWPTASLHSDVPRLIEPSRYPPPQTRSFDEKSIVRLFASPQGAR
jgi:hypothetical protein